MGPVHEAHGSASAFLSLQKPQDAVSFEAASCRLGGRPGLHGDMAFPRTAPIRT